MRKARVLFQRIVKTFLAGTFRLIRTLLVKSFIFAHFPTYSQIFLFFSLSPVSLFSPLSLFPLLSHFFWLHFRGVWDSGENCVRLVLRGGLPERSGEPLHVACLHRKLRVSRIQVHIFVSTVQTRTAAKSFLDGIAGIKAAVSEVLPRFQRKCGSWKSAFRMFVVGILMGE